MKLNIQKKNGLILEDFVNKMYMMKVNGIIVQILVKIVILFMKMIVLKKVKIIKKN